LGLIASTAIHCILTTSVSPSFEAKRTALTCVGYGLRCVRKLRLDHANRIAGLQLLTVHLAVSQMVQFAALGIAEVIVRRA
jgi:hypothetical protein